MNGRQRIRRQYEIIAKLESEGLSIKEAKRLLDRFETTQKIFEELYQSIQKEIDARLSK
jgi:DNA-binding transcriptional MerR regulator